MARFSGIVGGPARVLLALIALAGLLAVSSADAGVLQESGKSNLFVKELNKAGKAGSSITFTRFFVPTKGSLTVSNMPGGGLFGDSQIRVRVVNIETGATVLNTTATLTFANPSKTFSWPVTESGTGYRMTVTNLGSNKPLLIMEVK